MMRSSRLAALAAFVFGVSALATAQSLSSLAPLVLSQSGKPKVGAAMPKFSMTDLAGKSHTNQSLKGKVVLMDFWASWCGPCKAASPAMQRLHKEFASKGLVVIGANVFETSATSSPMTAAQARKLSKDNATAYSKEHKYTYTFTIDNDRLAESWGVSGVPQFYLLDKQGKLVREERGWDTSFEASMRAQIRKLLG